MQRALSYRTNRDLFSNHYLDDLLPETEAWSSVDAAEVEEAFTEIVRDPRQSNGAPTIEGTGIRIIDVAKAYEHSGYCPDEIAEFYPVLSLADIHTAIAYYYEHIDELRDTAPNPAS